MKYVFPTNYGEDCILLPIDTALIPLVSGAILHFQKRGYWITESDYEAAYNAFAELQADMSGRCIDRLIVEIRALRGGSLPAENWRDPNADPALIGLSTLGDGILETSYVNEKLVIANQKLDDIKAAIDASNTGDVAIEDVLNLILIALA